MTPKIISYDVEIKSTSKLWVQKVPEVYTNDSNSVNIQFNLIDCTEAELLNSTAQVLLYMRDGSFFQNTGVDVVRTGTTFSYTLKDNEGNHQGLTEVQLVLTIVGTPNEDYASQMYQFKIKNGLGNNVPVETFIQTWETLTTEANAFIAQMETDVQEFDVALESGVLATNIAAKLNNLETTYAPRLLSAEQQLADKVGGGVKAEPEDLSATTLGLVTGTGGPINLLSIPQDKSATWAKRTETGSFAKILLTGEVPNFNTSTGILTFPSDFRILVGTNYYSIAATTIDFSALVSTASQILILFNVSTLAFTAISPTSLTSAHDRSVIVATIKNVSGQRREPYMNCPFSVNNVPYIPDIERMLLSKAIPKTEQVVQYHASGVLNNIQHKDSDGNTIRTDTFTFSAESVVEERLHNQTYTKITFTTNLSTLTTEVI